jgi:3-oxoacyl-[acyl-carrier-protein] synthase II
MKKRIVISGLGALSAHGQNIEAICARSGALLPDEVRRRLDEDVDLLPVRNLNASAVSGRLRKKLDPFTIYGLCAADMAIKNSGVLESDIDRNRVGIFVGNCLGGWSFTEPELQKLHTAGVDMMSPYVATAWFPAALQGQISLQYDLKGYSKTYSASGVAGVQAIGYAAEAIQHGRADVIVCGASEDISSPYTHAVLQAYDYGSESRHSVYGKERHVDFAEGAAFMVIESLEHAKRRGAHIYGEITGFADHFCPSTSDREAVHKKNLTSAIGRTSNKHLLIMDGLFEDEPSVIGGTAAEADTPVIAATSKNIFGNMFAVSGVMELACIAYNLSRGAVRGDMLGEVATEDAFEDVIVRRLGKHGGMSTLTISAV